MFSYLILFITLFCNVIAITSHVCAEAPVLAINLCDKDGTSDFALLNKQQTVPRPILQTKFVLKKRAAPWTHDPKCTEKLEHGRSYCVYTSDTFANGRGISIFTTPRAAKQIAALAAFNVPGALDDVKELQDVPWHTEVIPGRGIGMIADRELARGDRLTAYTPLLLMHEQLEAFVSRAELEQFLQIAVDQLPADSRRMLLSLQGSEDGGESTIKDIVATNSFEFLVGKDQQPHFFVYPETSRFNHDCRANSHYYFSPENLAHYVHAVRAISPGEELTISYTFPLAPQEVRSYNIQHSWNFTCTCSRCNPATSSDSDIRIQSIYSFEGELSNWTRQSSATPEMAENLVRLYEAEGQYGLIGNAYLLAALTHSAAGHAAKAIEFAKLAVEAKLLSDGPDSEDIKSMESLVKAPKSHWSWNARKGIKEHDHDHHH